MNLEYMLLRKLFWDITRYAFFLKLSHDLSCAHDLKRYVLEEISVYEFRKQDLSIASKQNML